MAAPATTLHLIRAQDCIRSRWHNGCGWTREIHAEPLRGDATDIVDTADHSRVAATVPWQWRLSIAELTQPSPFSTLPGVDRELVLLQGDGLHFGGTMDHTLEPPHARLRFRGEDAVTATPVAGFAHVFNLMWRRDRVDATLWHRPLVGPMVVFVDPGDCWAVHVLAGEARAGTGATSATLARCDTALLRADDRRTRHALEGGGEALLMRVVPHRPAGEVAAQGAPARP